MRGRNTGIELAVFRELRRRGIYFVRHGASVVGRPDVVFRRCRLAVFVDGDFWHGRCLPKWQHKLSSAWRAKIERNIERDREIDETLRRGGWRVVRLWGSEIESECSRCVARIVRIRDRRCQELKRAKSS